MCILNSSEQLSQDSEHSHVWEPQPRLGGTAEIGKDSRDWEDSRIGSRSRDWEPQPRLGARSRDWEPQPRLVKHRQPRLGAAAAAANGRDSREWERHPAVNGSRSRDWEPQPQMARSRDWEPQAVVGRDSHEWERRLGLGAGNTAVNGSRRPGKGKYSAMHGSYNRKK